MDKCTKKQDDLLDGVNEGLTRHTVKIRLGSPYRDLRSQCLNVYSAFVTDCNVYRPARLLQ